jgi:PAS domain S-box-containing protein
MGFVLIFAHAIIRHRLMDLRLVVHRGLTIAAAMTISLLPVAILLAVFWPQLADHLEPHELVLLLAAVGIVSLLIPVTRDAMGKLLDRYVYRAQADYQRTVRDASRVLTRVLDMDRLLAFVGGTVCRSTRAEGVGIYLRGETGFEAAAVEHHAPGAHFQTPALAPPRVIGQLAATRDLLITEEIPRGAVTPEAEALHAELTALNWALLLPVVAEESVIGVIVLGPKLSGDPYYPQDLDLLTTLANQAGVAIKNAQLYAEVVLANQHLENLVATIQSGVIAVDARGRVTMFNRAAEQLTGLAAGVARDEGVGRLPAALGALLTATLETGQGRTAADLALSDGTVTRSVIGVASPLRDRTGRVLGAVAAFSDLTAVKELEAERRRVERLAYFQVMAAGIAHEIKNPLVAIKTFAQLIPDRHDDPAFVGQFSRIVTREIGRMERVIDGIGMLARPNRPRHALDLRAPIGDAVEIVQPVFDEKGVGLQVTLGDDPCYVLGDHGELEQLFLNLLMNGHEAAPPGGRVVVCLAREGDAVAVEVADTGPGIPAEILERIFDPFFTTRPNGSGLGLAISSGIAGAHGGRLRAGNRPDGGATFTLELAVPDVAAAVNRA